VVPALAGEWGVEGRDLLFGEERFIDYHWKCDWCETKEKAPRPGGAKEG